LDAWSLAGCGYFCKQFDSQMSLEVNCDFSIDPPYLKAQVQVQLKADLKLQGRVYWGFWITNFL
jgi:hypothetical protein